MVHGGKERLNNIPPALPPPPLTTSSHSSPGAMTQFTALASYPSLHPFYFIPPSCPVTNRNIPLSNPTFTSNWSFSFDLSAILDPSLPSLCSLWKRYNNAAYKNTQNTEKGREHPAKMSQASCNMATSGISTFNIG